MSGEKGLDRVIDRAMFAMKKQNYEGGAARIYEFLGYGLEHALCLWLQRNLINRSPVCPFKEAHALWVKNQRIVQIY